MTSQVAQFVTDLKDQATAAMRQGFDKAQLTINAADISWSAGSADPIDPASLGLPTIPAAPTFQSMQSDFAAALLKPEEYIDKIQTSWISNYFPAAMPLGLDDLLTKITNGAIVTATEQEIMWARARNQAVRDAARASDEAINRWASRGFALPGGVVNNQVQMVSQELLHVSADLAAQQAIKALDIQVDAVKFAAETGVKLRLGLLNSLSDLIKVYSQIPLTAAEYAKAEADAKRMAQSVILDYYKAMFASADIKLKAKSANMDSFDKELGIMASYLVGQIGNRVHAAQAAAEIYAKGASAALSGINAIASDVSTTTV